jgi:hypothetical protein
MRRTCRRNGRGGEYSSRLADLKHDGRARHAIDALLDLRYLSVEIRPDRIVSLATHS